MWCSSENDDKSAVLEKAEHKFYLKKNFTKLTNLKS